MGAILDTKRHYGTIMGDVHGRVFEQDGKFFNADGGEWTPADSPIGVNNAEASMRARIETDVRKKVTAEIEAKVRAELEGHAGAAERATSRDDQVEQQLAEGDAALETLGLQTKVLSALRGAKINSVNALAACTEDQLVNLSNFGAAALSSVKKALRAAGKRLAG